MSEQIYYGAFLSLKVQGVVDPQDISDFNQVQKDMFSRQCLVLVFGAFWARMYEMMRYKPLVANRVLQYGLLIGIPSVVHAFCISAELQNFTSKFDLKYQDQYKIYLQSKRDERKQTLAQQ